MNANEVNRDIEMFQLSWKVESKHLVKDIFVYVQLLCRFPKTGNSTKNSGCWAMWRRITFASVIHIAHNVVHYIPIQNRPFFALSSQLTNNIPKMEC